jgi:hypothetical protein
VNQDSSIERELMRLLYVSIAAPALDAGDLDAIAARSAERNRTAGLTGLLLHEGDRFFAVLEGPRRRLFARMERIITDPRHAGVQILVEASAAERRFANWRFGRLPGSRARGSAAEDFLRSFGLRLG